MSLPVDKLSTVVNDQECTIDLEALKNEYQMLESRLQKDEENLAATFVCEKNLGDNQLKVQSEIHLSCND